MSQPLLLLASLKHAREAKKVPIAGIPDLGHRVPSLSSQTRFPKFYPGTPLPSRPRFKVTSRSGRDDQRDQRPEAKRLMGDREIRTVSNRVVVLLTYTLTPVKGADLTQ